jgi:hypothetical protein
MTAERCARDATCRFDLGIGIVDESIDVDRGLFLSAERCIICTHLLARLSLM